MQNPNPQPVKEMTEPEPRYLDQWLEPRDHANQWDVTALMREAKLEARNDGTE